MGCRLEIRTAGWLPSSSLMAVTDVGGGRVALLPEATVGLHDVLHDLVAHHVPCRPGGRTRCPRCPRGSPARRASPEVCPLCRSVCVESPFTTAFDPNPIRVRNIFICSGVVFCASSRMMNASFSVRPRMNASGRDLDGAALHQPRQRVGAGHLEQRVVERAHVRVDLLVERAGQEAEALAGLHGRPREDEPRDLMLLQRAHGGRDGEVGLAGARRTDRERHGRASGSRRRSASARSSSA